MLKVKEANIGFHSMMTAAVGRACLGGLAAVAVGDIGQVPGLDLSLKRWTTTAPHVIITPSAAKLRVGGALTLPQETACGSQQSRTAENTSSPTTNANYDSSLDDIREKC